MKILSAAVAALFVFGFVGAASAECSGYGKASAEQAAAEPIIVKPGSAGS